MAATVQIFLHHDPKNWVRVVLGDFSLSFHYPNSTHSTVPFHHVLFVHVEGTAIEISFLKKRNKNALKTIHLRGTIADSTHPSVSEWAETILTKVYDERNIKRSPSLFVIVNPHGGIGKGRSIYHHLVSPILKAARCNVEVAYTSGRHHAYEMVQSMSLSYDTVLSVSGDGLVHEIFNGFANHKEDPIKALAIPVVPIPTGSGNGLSLNLLGSEYGFDVVSATLNAIKGRKMPVDLFSVVQGGKRSFSFMSQAVGLMADLDLGTEHLRWMGDSRFVYGLLRGVAFFKPCPAQLWYKGGQLDKKVMYETHKSQKASIPTTPSPTYQELPSSTLPTDDDEGWTLFDQPLLYVYAGKGPYVGRDLMMFPVSLPDDGLIDIAAQPLSSRADILSSFSDADKGVAYWKPSLQYIKAQAYRIRPLPGKTFLSIDGEAFPFQEFQVEVHQALGTVRSPTGRYAADFTISPP